MLLCVLRSRRGKKGNTWDAVHSSINSIFAQRERRESQKRARAQERELTRSVKERKRGRLKDEL